MRGTMRRLHRTALVLCLVLPTIGAAQESYSFDVSSFEKKPLEFGGYAELRGESFRLDQGSALYQLGFFDQTPRERFNRATGTLQLNALYRKGIVSAHIVAHGSYQDDYRASEQDTRLYEGYVSVEPETGRHYELGKQALAWGKGYAWNPVGFVQRPKDPNDPDLARQGFTIAGAEFVHSGTGDLKTVALSPLLVPTFGGTNADFGPADDTGHTNPAARLYLLYKDTDIDVMALGQGSRSARYGFDFSRNLATNFEVHGEWAHVDHAALPVVDGSGGVAIRGGSAESYLLGLRYLTEGELTAILEYYHNGTGYSDDELAAIASTVHQAYDQYQVDGDPSRLRQLRSSFQPSLMQANPGRNYLYLRLSQSQPFDILYWTPALTVMTNLDDGSYSLAPELLYTGITNLELRARVFWLHGTRLSDFGEKQNERRLELRLRLYF